MFIKITIIHLRSGKTGKMSKKLPREIRSVWNTMPSIHLFKPGNSVVYSDPKDARVQLNLGKYVPTILVHFKSSRLHFISC